MAITSGSIPKLFLCWQLYLGSLFEMVNHVKLSLGVTSIIFDDYDCHIIDCECQLVACLDDLTREVPPFNLVYIASLKIRQATKLSKGMQEKIHLFVYLGSLVQLFNYFKKETYRNRDFNFEFACEKLLTTYFHEKVPKISNCHEIFGLIKLFSRKRKQINQLVVIV